MVGDIDVSNGTDDSSGDGSKQRYSRCCWWVVRMSCKEGDVTVTV